MRPWQHRVDRYVANSQATARALAVLGGKGAPDLQVITPFVSEDAFGSDTSSRPDFVPSTGDYLMFAGALTSHKGFDTLLEAWAGVEPRVPLVAVGFRRPDTPRTLPEGVTLAEDVAHDDVLRAWGHCLVALVPSRYPEPFGVVALEAMAAGRPVIASAVGGLPGLVVDGRTGITVPPGDVGSLRAAIQRLVADRSLIAKMGAAGRKSARAYSADVVVPEWERVFREVVAGKAENSREQEVGIAE